MPALLLTMNRAGARFKRLVGSVRGRLAVTRKAADPANCWAANLESGELGHWRSWFSEDRFEADREARRAALARSFARDSIESLQLDPGEVIRILDVGCGPISTLPTRAPDHPVELVCVDPLGEQYNALLAGSGYDDCPRIQPGKGEELVDLFGENAFHLVSIANALDHCEDPAETLIQMYRVCRPGGEIVVVSFENEGEWEGYSGLHVWNLVASDDALRLWSRTSDDNLLDLLPGPFRYSWRYQEGGSDDDHRIFRAVIEKVQGSI